MRINQGAQSQMDSNPRTIEHLKYSRVTSSFEVSLPVLLPVQMYIVNNTDIKFNNKSYLKIILILFFQLVPSKDQVEITSGSHRKTYMEFENVCGSKTISANQIGGRMRSRHQF